MNAGDRRVERYRPEGLARCLDCYREFRIPPILRGQSMMLECDRCGAFVRVEDSGGDDRSRMVSVRPDSPPIDDYVDAVATGLADQIARETRYDFDADAAVVAICDSLPVLLSEIVRLRARVAELEKKSG